MARTISYEKYLNMLSERVIDNSRQLKKDTHQRRNGMEDLYGVCFSANGDATTPASFYVSLSPDYGYLQRFAFKFVIKPYVSTVSGASGGSLTISDTSLAVTAEQDPTTSEITAEVTPNPHSHTVSGSIGSLDYGITHIDTASTDWRVHIGGVDITPYLIAQHDGEWINGEGIFPNDKLGHIGDFYDILEVCDALTDEGEIEKRDKILESEFKKVEIFSDAPFGCDAYLYLKYNHTNR